MINNSRIWTSKRSFCDYFKVCRKQTILKENGKYGLKKINTNYIDSLGNGNFVNDIKACESDFTLLFYGDRKTIKLDTNEETEDNMFKMCVEVNEFGEFQRSCFINYTIGEKKLYL